MPIVKALKAKDNPRGKPKGQIFYPVPVSEKLLGETDCGLSCGIA
jgi:hypothetical protein